MKEEKKEKKGSFLGTLAVIIIILCIALIVFILSGKGFGFGNGNGNGDGSGVTDVFIEESSSEEPEDETQAETEVIEYTVVTVSGNDYIYNNDVTPLDELIEIISGSENIVSVKDNEASLKAYEDLINALNEKGIEYIEQDGE